MEGKTITLSEEDMVVRFLVCKSTPDIRTNPKFWVGNSGYTTDVSEAKVYSSSELEQLSDHNVVILPFDTHQLNDKKSLKRAVLLRLQRLFYDFPEMPREELECNKYV